MNNIEETTDIELLKPRILVIGRWTEMPKGFSRILNDLFSTCIWQDKFDICHYAWHRPTTLTDSLERFNVVTMSASNDNRLLNILQNIYPDIILVIGDMFTIEHYKNVLGSWNGMKIAYIFVDGENIPYTWKNTLSIFDYIVSATQFGKIELDKFNKENNVLKNPVQVINPPVDRNIFKPISQHKRKEYRNILKLDDNDFVITYVTINALRKGIEISFELLEKTIKELKDKKMKVKLILHSDYPNPIETICKYFNLEGGEVFISSGNKKDTELARYYQMSDLVINTSLSEGWGLPLSEAISCGTPVLAPNHSGIRGALGLEKNILNKEELKIVKTREEYFLYDVLPHTEYLYNSDCIVFVKRPDTRSAVKKIKKIAGNDPKTLNYRKEIIQEGLRRAEEIDKFKIAQQWLYFFQQLMIELKDSNRSLETLNIPKTTFYRF